MVHTITTSDSQAFVATCSCGWEVHCGEKHFRDTQVDNHEGQITGFHRVYCKGCKYAVGMVPQGSINTGGVWCGDCAEERAKESVRISYGT